MRVPAKAAPFFAAPEPRLKVQIWVQAQIRLCDVNLIQAVVVRRGDADAGAVVMRLIRGVQKSVLLRRQIQADGTSKWEPAGGAGELDDAAAEAYLAREIKRDPDLWIVEVDDPKGRYWPDKAITP